MVIGGAGAWSLVTEYSGLDDDEQIVLGRKTASFQNLVYCNNLEFKRT